MSRRLSSAFSVLCLVGFLAGPCFAEDLDDQADRLVADALAEGRLVGIWGAVSVDGKLEWSGGAGWADIENRVVVSGQTVGRIGSISKPMAAVTVLRLVEQGRVRLADPVNQHVPAFPAKRWPVTLRHVLNHTSGIRHYKPGEFGTMKHYDSVADAVGVFAGDPLKFQPGTRYSYSSFAYNLLAGVVERHAEGTFRDTLRRTIWGPAGMSSTNLEVQGELVPRRARGYVRNTQGRTRNAPYADLSVKWAGGGVISSPVDLVRFSDALLGGRLVSSRTLEEMATRGVLADGKKTSYGLGLSVGSVERLGREIGHGGGSTGFSSRWSAFPEQRISVAVITNLRDQDSGKVVGRVARALAKIALEERDD